MQTFLPDEDFQLSVAYLDNKRLGNQVYRECLTILNGGWKNHPVSVMWQGYRWALAEYALCGIEELKKRGKHYAVIEYRLLEIQNDCTRKDEYPYWLGNKLLHMSHRKALLYKDFSWYSQFGWSETPAKPSSLGIYYHWPKSRFEVNK